MGFPINYEIKGKKDSLAIPMLIRKGRPGVITIKFNLIQMKIIIHFHFKFFTE